LQKLVLVHCIEAVGKVSLTHAAPIGRAIAQRLSKPLVYFGPHHLDTEAGHTLEDEGVRHSLESASLSDDEVIRLRALIDETFAAFTDFSDELLTFATRVREGTERDASATI
jgi:hypothetical protein